MFAFNEKLETEIELDGTIYPLQLAFDNVMNVLELLGDVHLSDLEKVQVGLHRLLGVIPELEVDALVRLFNAIVEHFIQGTQKEEDVDLNGDPMPVGARTAVYDLKHDGAIIFASFKQAYGIDLVAEQGKLDWRLFKVYLRELPDETRFKQVVGIRMQKLPTGKHMAKERERIQKLKRIYALPEGG